MKNKRQSGAILLLIMAMLCTSCGNSAMATTMQLIKTEGKVSVMDGRGSQISLMENMNLYSGYNMETQKESYAWINLDSVKLTKMSDESEIEIQKNGNQLEILVNSGSLYFNITEPLAEDETLNIRTSTMAVGIRGTCGWVNVTERPCMRVYILEGTVTCSVTDESGQEITAAVSGGEMAEITEGEIQVSPFLEPAIPAFVLEELLEEEELRQKIREDSGLAIPGVTSEDSGASFQGEQEESKEQNKSEEQGASADIPEGIWAPVKEEWNGDYLTPVASINLVEGYREMPEENGGMISFEEMQSLSLIFRQFEAGIWCYRDSIEQISEAEYGEMAQFNMDGYEWRTFAWGGAGDMSVEEIDEVLAVFEKTYWISDAQDSKNWERVEDVNHQAVDEEKSMIFECYTEYNFTVTHGGEEHTECKLLQLAATVTTNERCFGIVLARVPKGYDGVLSLTLYGNMEEDEELVINRDESVTFLF